MQMTTHQGVFVSCFPSINFKKHLFQFNLITPVTSNLNLTYKSAKKIRTI